MHVAFYDDVRIDTADPEEAARMSNECRRSGVAGSSIDFLLCAVAKRRGWQLFTTDDDFQRYAHVLDDVRLVPIDESLSTQIRKYGDV